MAKDAKVRFGVLGVAKIAVEKVIPAMQRGERAEVVAIASRDLAKAEAAAKRLGLPRAYGDYAQLLADGNVDAIYNPLPNHLHVPWSIRALEAGKHVLCEKPIALSSPEALELVAAGKRFPRLKLMEAFMYRHHPQWVRAREMVDRGDLGQVLAIQSFFSYFNRDPANVRNQAEIGGGALMDIGCYPISLSRFIFRAEPRRVVATIDRDPDFRVDRLVSATMDFGEPGGRVSSFVCGTQLAPYQRVQIVGDAARFEIEIPFNAPPDRPCRAWVERGGETKEIVFPVCDQYTIQGDLFARSIQGDSPVPTPIEDAVANMKVIEALVRSSDRGGWETV